MRIFFFSVKDLKDSYPVKVETFIRALIVVYSGEALLVSNFD